MRKGNKVQSIMAASALAAFSASAALGATTPYDMIRPTWPLSWDEKVFETFDTTITQKTGMLPKQAIPESFMPAALMPDTLDQAYLDAINSKISPIRVNQAGYLESDPEKRFYYIGNQTEFEVVDAIGRSLSTPITGNFVPSGATATSDWTIIAGTDATTNDSKRYKVDFSGTAGKLCIGYIPGSVPANVRLRIRVGEDLSSTFIISDEVYTMAKDATLKFFGIQRSGNSESWFHGPSHVQDGAGSIVLGTSAVTTSGISPKAGDLQGGWYDCGDHLKESQTQAFAFMALAVMSATNPAKDVDHYAYNHAEFVETDNVPDVLREAKHGADFFLRAFRVANGVIDDMPVSVGNFGSDHGFWGRPEVQDLVTVSNRGGPHERDIRLGELGSNISGQIAAGLAILGKDYAPYDKDFADSCLMVAEKMYDFAKALAQGKSTYDDGKQFKNNIEAAGWSTPAYNGNNDFFDDLALASVALLYATGKKLYADDMIRTRNLYQGQSYMDGVGCFEGGWFVSDNKGFLKNVKNTSWANSHAYATYALYKLILADKTKAVAEYGLTETERLNAIEDCVADMIYNLSDVSKGTAVIVLPRSSAWNDIGWKPVEVKYDPIWFTMQTDQDWSYNRYQVGNIFEVLAYADVVADIERQGITLPYMGTPNWKVDEIKQLGINQLNYMFGVNPWDISFVYGVGDKNDAHVHHRAANPEGRNTSGFGYKYVCPTGGLFGAKPPNMTSSMVPNSKSWEDYHLSEACLDASAILLSALTIVSNGGNDYYEKKCSDCKADDVTPFGEKGIYAAAYFYEFSSLDFFNLKLVNNSMVQLDSVVAYIYFEATEEDAKSCSVIFDLDICRAYDMAGFIKPCSSELETAIKNELRKNDAEKIDFTYNKEKRTYTWIKPIVLPTMEVGTTIGIDVSVSSGISTDGGETCETLRVPSTVKLGGSWSFASHEEAKDAPFYEGTPTWDKDHGDIQEAPQDPYIVIRSKGELLWGYEPSAPVEEEYYAPSPRPRPRSGIVQIAQQPSVQMQLSRNTLFVQATTQGSKTLKIFDVLGNVLLAKTFSGASTEVNLAGLPRRGTMIARLTSEGKLLATKAIAVR